MSAQNLLSAGVLLICICSSAYAIYYLVTPKTIGQQLDWDGLEPLGENDPIWELTWSHRKNNPWNINSPKGLKNKCIELFRIALYEDKNKDNYNTAKNWCIRKIYL